MKRALSMKALQSQFHSSETDPSDPGLAPLECAAISRNALVTHCYGIFCPSRDESWRGAIAEEAGGVANIPGLITSHDGLDCQYLSDPSSNTSQSKAFFSVPTEGEWHSFSGDKSSK